jgi:anti-anti-sigma factor
MDLWYSPIPGALPDGILRVAPDILPEGSIRIGEVTIDGEHHTDFDADALTVRVPGGRKRVKIRVQVVPTRDPFAVHTHRDEKGLVELRLSGKLDASTFREFQAEVEDVMEGRPSTLVLQLGDLDAIASVGLRVLLFARQKMDVADRADIYAVAPKPSVREAILRADPDQEDIHIVEEYPPKG